MEFLKNKYTYCLTLLIVLINLNGLTLFAQISENDSSTMELVSEDIFVDKNCKPNIKTVQFHRNGWDMSPPLIKMNTGEKLKLTFDDLDADGKEYSYTIIHCDANWQQSDIEKYEYIDGYEEDYIYDFQYSANTIVQFTHYELLFPTDDLKPELSGNYILKVYFDHEDSLYFTRRFMIVDQQVAIEGRVKQATVIEDRNYKQEVDFEVLAQNYTIVNPYRDMKVIIQQNGRWDNAVTDLKPKMVINGKLDFNYDAENVFDGGNEFRALNLKSLKYNAENIAKIDYTWEGYQVTLRPDEKRPFKIYRSADDINGQMKIKTEDQSITETQAEYVNVHFFLPVDAPLIDGDIYINGQLTNWFLDDESKMVYNFQRKGYEKTMLLKQGYYDYQYVMKYRNENVGDVGFIEGNHWETRNKYTILVYNREPG